MIRQRKVYASGEKPAGYYVIAKGDDGQLERKFFAHTRADEYRHAEFVEHKRSNANHKPYRSKALKALARAKAIIVGGTFVSDIGVLHHAV